MLSVFSIMMEKVINFPRTVYNLFVNSKFSVHRIFGLLYLIQWFSALFPEMAKPTSTHQNQMGWNPRLSTQKPTWVFGFLGYLKYIYVVIALFIIGPQLLNELPCKHCDTIVRYYKMSERVKKHLQRCLNYQRKKRIPDGSSEGKGRMIMKGSVNLLVDRVVLMTLKNMV